MAAPSNNSKMAVSDRNEIQIDWNIYTPRLCSLHTMSNVVKNEQRRFNPILLLLSWRAQSATRAITCQIDSIKLDCIRYTHIVRTRRYIEHSGSTMSYARDVYSRCRVMENINIPSESILHLLLFPRKLCFFFLYSPPPLLSLAECSGQNGGSSRDRSQSEEDFPAHPPKKEIKREMRLLSVVFWYKYCGGLPLSSEWGGAKKMTRKKKKKLFYFLLLLFTPWFSIFLNLSLAAWAAVIDAEQRKSIYPRKMRSCWRRNKCVFFLYNRKKRRKSFDGNRHELLTWHWWCGKPGKSLAQLVIATWPFFVIFFSVTFLFFLPPRRGM